MKKLIALVLALVLALSLTAVVAEEEAAWSADSALAALLADNPAEENFLVLYGIGDGWAPVIMVLDNDGAFVALVDYAGQAIVNFVTGEYEVNEDGSITCEGVQYNTGEDLIYEIVLGEDGFYTVEVEVPDTGIVMELTNKPAED